MRKLINILLIMIGATLFITPVKLVFAQSEPSLMEVCHIVPVGRGNGDREVQLLISSDSLATHLDHGDVLEPCENPFNEYTLIEICHIVDEMSVTTAIATTFRQERSDS